MQSIRLIIAFSHLSSLEVAFRAKQKISGALTFSKNGDIMRQPRELVTQDHGLLLLLTACFPTSLHLVLTSYS